MLSIVGAVHNFKVTRAYWGWILAQMCYNGLVYIGVAAQRQGEFP